MCVVCRVCCRDNDDPHSTGVEDNDHALFVRSLTHIDSWDFDVRAGCHCRCSVELTRALLSSLPVECAAVDHVDMALVRMRVACLGQVFLVDRISRGRALEHVAKLLFLKRNLEQR